MKTIFFIAILLLPGFIIAQNVTPTIRFGIIADPQYCDCEPNGTRYYRNSLVKLDSCVAAFNREKVQFVINLGDLIDRNPESFTAPLDTLNKLDAKVYHTTGNHDYDGVKKNKALYKKLGMPSEYYSFKIANWRFIVLNTNEISSYANPSGRKKKELNAMMEKINAEGGKNGQPWNGGISHKQLEWLNNTLKKAQAENENVLVFGHHPIYPFSDFCALNDKDIVSTLAAFTCVKAYINGHHHAGAHAVYNHIHCITMQGMVETEHENAYSIVDIYPNEIIINGWERSSSYNIRID